MARGSSTPVRYTFGMLPYDKKIYLLVERPDVLEEGIYLIETNEGSPAPIASYDCRTGYWLLHGPADVKLHRSYELDSNSRYPWYRVLYQFGRFRDSSESYVFVTHSWSKHNQALTAYCEAVRF